MYSSNSEIKKKVTFILAAAGQGKRMNLNSPKQFLDYKGEPLFYYSIYNAIKKIEDTDIVIIQDAARPFLKDKYIEESIKILDNNCDGAIIGVKCKDTIKIIDENGIVLKTPNRDSLIMVHTPQTFKFEILKKAHQMAEKKNILTTDDASLVEMIFGKVKIIYGDYDNIKITVQEDLKFLK